jgi:DNA-directed RNA polymerase specialized sigma24 family protein
MSGYVDWIGAQADEPDPGDVLTSRRPFAPADERTLDGSSRADASWQKLPIHNFPGQPQQNEALLEDTPAEAWEKDWDGDPDIWLYRKKTWTLLRRYMQWSLEAGRLPSLLGRELFRAKITAYTATTFESRVIFLHDMERCLDRLQDFDRQLIARVCLQEYDHETAARILHCTRKTIERRLPDLIDELSEAFLKADLLDRLPETNEEGR